MKDEGCAHKDRNALCLLGDGVWSQKEQALSNAEDQRDGRVEGVFAWCRCPLPVLHPLFPLPQLTARPNPSRIVAQSLIYLLQAPGCPIASLPNCCSTQRDPDACTTTCTAMQHLLLNLPLQTGRTAGVVVVAAGAGRPSRCALPPASQGLSMSAPQMRVPTCQLPLPAWPIYRDGLCCLPRAASRSGLPRRLRSRASHLCSIGLLTRCAAGCFDSHDSLSSSTVVHLSADGFHHCRTCTSQVHLCQRPY